MVLGETGLIGLVAAFSFFVGMAVILWRTASRAGSPRTRMIALAALFVVVEGLIRSATSSVYVAPPIGYFVLGTAGVALAATSVSEPATDEEAEAA
jgi:O-antigen ligase